MKPEDMKKLKKKLKGFAKALGEIGFTEEGAKAFCKEATPEELVEALDELVEDSGLLYKDDEVEPGIGQGQYLPMPEAPWTKEAVQALLDLSDGAVERALLAIWKFQTDAEQRTEETRDHNDIGFSAFHAKPAAYYVSQLKRGYKLPASKMAKARNMMKRYWKQLLEIANAKAEAKA